MENVYPRTLIGIQNEENVCYLNSVLQIFFNLDKLNEYIDKSNFDSTTSSNFINRYKKTWDIIKSEKFEIDTENVICSSYIKNYLEKYNNMYEGCYQHDAHEILVSILNLLHEGFVKNFNKQIPEMLVCNTIFNVPMDKLIFFSQQCWINEIKRDSHSIINNLFKGQIRSKITCQICLSEFNKFDTFNNLTLPIPDLDMEKIDINLCIKEFCESEFMCDKNKFFCNNCNKNTEAIKEIILWKLPIYLILHFNRFIYNEETYELEKNDTSIDFPIKNFKLNNNSLYANPSSNYNLTGSVIHHGDTIVCGHYTSEIIVNDKIYNLDDEEIIQKEKFNDKPYLLIYKMDI